MPSQNTFSSAMEVRSAQQTHVSQAGFPDLHTAAASGCQYQYVGFAG